MEIMMTHHTLGPKSSVIRDAGATLLLILVLMASLALNVRLGWKVSKLQGLLAGSTPVNRLSLGTEVPPIRATGLEGKQTTITYAGSSPTVLYVFIPPCGWCARNLANIQALARDRGKTYHFVGLSLTNEHLKEYAARSGIDFPVYSVGTEAINALGLGNTPQTLIVSPDGKLLANWVGAYGGDLRVDIETYFAMKLPGLTK